MLVRSAPCGGEVQSVQERRVRDAALGAILRPKPEKDHSTLA